MLLRLQGAHGVPDREHVKVLVAESSVDAARDAIEAMSEPDELV